MGRGDELRALEELKARYCRTLDLKDWEGLRACFTDDFVSDTLSSGGKVTRGADEFMDFLRLVLSKAVTVHQVQQPEIELLTPTTAKGVWAMMDVVRLRRGVTLHGFGHYLETYEKVDGEWRIRTSTLTRLREEIRTPLFTVYISDGLRRLVQRVAVRS